MDMKVLSQEPLTLADVKDSLKDSSDKDNFRLNKTKEYLETFAKLSSKKADELKKKILDLKIPRLKNEMVVKVIDLLPDNEDYLNLIFQAYPVTISSSNLKKIVSTVEEFKTSLK